jgi:hypothetical protein
MNKISKFVLIVSVLSLLAAGCSKIELKQEQPSSPKESYGELPR